MILSATMLGAWVLVGLLARRPTSRSRGLAAGTAVALYGAILGGLATSVAVALQLDVVAVYTTEYTWRTVVLVAGVYSLIAIARAERRARRATPS